MVRAFLLALGVLGVLASGARTARAETLVLVEVPPVVESALRTSLAPWSVEIVVVALAPAVYDPAAVAGEHDASFVAWRRGRDLVLYDAAAASEERRPLAAEPDDAEAAAIALSIKTWMGLGAPPGDGLICGGDECPRPPPRTHRWLAEAMLGVRAEVAGQGAIGFRYGLAGGARYRRYEGGLRVDLGTDHDGVAFGQDGAWAVTSASAWARAGFAVTPSITVLPGIGLGLVYTSFDAPRAAPGEHAESASTTGFALDGEVGARWQRGRISAGARLGVTAIPRTQLLRSRNLEAAVDAHVEPWFLATMSVGL